LAVYLVNILVQNGLYFRFYVLTAFSLNIQFFWDGKLCRWTSTSRRFEVSSSFIFRVKQCDTAEDLHPKPLHVYPNTNAFPWHTVIFINFLRVLYLSHQICKTPVYWRNYEIKYNCLNPSVVSGFHSVYVEDVLLGCYGLCRR
jgi:hypothetical protein